MKKRIFTLISILLCTAVMLPAFALADTLTLPGGLTIIDEESFAGTDALDTVIVQENTKRIESRAFAGSSAKEIYLPESIEFIAEDAFAGCENLTLMVPKDSFAHRWAAFSDVKYSVLSDEEMPAQAYSLSGLDIDGKTVSVTASTGAACALLVRFIDEDTEDILLNVSGNAAAELRSDNVQLDITGTLPEYYILEAVLADLDGNELCRPIRNNRHTRAYASFADQQKDDFPAGRVIDFGDAGYAVLAEGVKYVSGAESLGGGKYSIPASALARSAAPAEGDVLMLNINGAYTPVKVSSAVMGANGSITIEDGGRIYLSDVYDHLTVDGYMEADGSAAGAEVGNAFNYKDNFSFLDGKLKVDVDAGMSIYVTAEYNKKFLGADYFYFDVEGKIWGNAKGTFSAAFSTSELEKPIELKLYEGKVIIPGLNLPADLTVTLPFNASIEGEGNATANFEKIIGFTWDSDNGFVKKEDPGKNFVDAEAEVNFHADCGPEVTLDIGFWDFFGAKVSGQVGLDADGTMSGKAHAGYEEPKDDDQIHACDLCLSLDVDIFAKANANIYYNITEDCSGDLLDKEIFNISGDLMEKHHSIINEKESWYEGVPTWGDGSCPNYKYKVNISTVDMYDKTVKNIPVTITHSNGKVMGSLDTPGFCHLYDGNYTAEATFKSGVTKESFSVIGASKPLTIKEKELTISVYAVNNNTGAFISGAKVTLTLPNGKTKTATTDANGCCKFDKLVGGKYSILVTRDGFKAKEAKDMDFPSGVNASFNAALVPDTPMLSATLRRGSSGYSPVYAVTSNGENPGFTLKLEAASSGAAGAMGSLRLTHSGISQPFTYECLCYTVYLYAADMGDGAYTYILNMYGSIDNRCIVLREAGDKFEIALDFSYLGRSGSTCGVNGNPGGYVDYNNAQKLAGSTTGPMRQKAEFISGGNGGYILQLTTEEANYTGGTTPIWRVKTDYEMIDSRLTITNQTIAKW